MLGLDFYVEQPHRFNEIFAQVEAEAFQQHQKEKQKDVERLMYAPSLSLSKDKELRAIAKSNLPHTCSSSSATGVDSDSRRRGRQYQKHGDSRGRQQHQSNSRSSSRSSSSSRHHHHTKKAEPQQKKRFDSKGTEIITFKDHTPLNAADEATQIFSKEFVTPTPPVCGSLLREQISNLGTRHTQRLVRSTQIRFTAHFPENPNFPPLRMELDGSLTSERVMHEIIQAFKNEHNNSSSPGRPAAQNPMSVVPNIAMSTCPPESSHLKMDPHAAVNFTANVHRNGDDESPRVQIGRVRTDSMRPQIHNALDSPRYGRPHAAAAYGGGAGRPHLPGYASAGSATNLSTHPEGGHAEQLQELAGANGSAPAAPIEFILKYDSCDHYELRMVDEDDFSPDLDFPALQRDREFKSFKMSAVALCPRVSLTSKRLSMRNRTVSKGMEGFAALLRTREFCLRVNLPEGTSKVLKILPDQTLQDLLPKISRRAVRDDISVQKWNFYYPNENDPISFLTKGSELKSDKVELKPKEIFKKHEKTTLVDDDSSYGFTPESAGEYHEFQVTKISTRNKKVKRLFGIDARHVRVKKKEGKNARLPSIPIADIIEVTRHDRKGENDKYGEFGFKLFYNVAAPAKEHSKEHHDVERENSRSYSSRISNGGSSAETVYFCKEREDREKIVSQISYLIKLSHVSHHRG